MRRSARRWLLHRRKPKMEPLVFRTSWPDFADRMHKAIAIDMAIMLGEVSRADLLRQQVTKPLPVVLAEAETVADKRYWWWTNERIEAACSIDQYATMPMALAEMR